MQGLAPAQAGAQGPSLQAPLPSLHLTAPVLLASRTPLPPLHLTAPVLLVRGLATGLLSSAYIACILLSPEYSG